MKVTWAIFSALVMEAIAPVLAVREGPINASTFSPKIRFSALLLAKSGFDPSSSIRILIGRPPTPPRSLIFFSASKIPLLSGWPSPAPGPVNERTEPIFIGSCCANKETGPIEATAAMVFKVARRVAEPLNSSFNICLLLVFIDRVNRQDHPSCGSLNDRSSRFCVKELLTQPKWLSTTSIELHLP